MRFAPHVSREHLATHGLPSVTSEVRQKLELLGRQEDRPRTANDAPAFQIEKEVGDLLLRWLPFAGPAEHHPKACQQFCEGEGLDEIVVGSGVEPQYTILDSVARCEK